MCNSDGKRSSQPRYVGGAGSSSHHPPSGLNNRSATTGIWELESAGQTDPNLFQVPQAMRQVVFQNRRQGHGPVVRMHALPGPRFFRQSAEKHRPPRMQAAHIASEGSSGPLHESGNAAHASWSTASAWVVFSKNQPGPDERIHVRIGQMMNDLERVPSTVAVWIVPTAHPSPRPAPLQFAQAGPRGLE